jgi:hypothetical protein
MKIFMTACKMITVLILLNLISLESICQVTPNQEDSVCLTAEDARVIFKDLQLFQYCDSIRTEQTAQITILKRVLKTNDNIIAANNLRLLEVTKTLNTTRKKLKFSASLSKFGIPVALGGGFIIGFLLAK